MKAAIAALVIALQLVASAWAHASSADGAPVNPFEGKIEVAEEGRSLFNQYCAHCHGPNAVQGERPRDLRRLKARYGDDAAKVFYETISTGLPDKGMPVWKGVLSDEVLWRIYTYLQTVQSAR
jgi:mono/diheme cytochrome c family protein